MTVSQTPISAVERKRARRHKIARRLYEQLVAQNPNRVIILRDRAGKVVARHDMRPEQDDPEIVSSDAAATCGTTIDWKE
jgi:hypothetical protein